MADAHFGLGATVGSVVATKHALLPSAVGVDIGCGMVAAETSLTAAGLPDAAAVACFGVLILSLASLTFLGCGSSKYPANVQRNFLNSCEANGSVPRCDCVLSYLEAHVSLNTFKAADAAIDAGDTNYPSWLLKAASSCANA